jgi:2-oxoglutarate ferredoxin oxidoreductase subunit gamma
MSRCRIIFSGSGGQGVITASIILAEAAAIQEGLNAVQSQAYGPEARGGATRADVIIDEKPIRFPKVNHPNILICLTQEAYNKFYDIIRPGGVLLIDPHFVKYPQRKVDARQFSLDMYTHVMEEIGKPIVFNICVLGALLGLYPVVNPDSVLEVLKAKIPAEFVDMNRRALDIGSRLAQNPI